jgi:hypothetical protein
MMKQMKRIVVAAATKAMTAVGKPPLTQWKNLPGDSVSDKLDSFLELID